MILEIWFRLFFYFYHFDFGTNFDSFVSDCLGYGKYGVIFSCVGEFSYECWINWRQVWDFLVEHQSQNIMN